MDTVPPVRPAGGTAEPVANRQFHTFTQTPSHGTPDAYTICPTCQALCDQMRR